MGIMEAATQRNLSISEDLAVVGFDDTVLALSMELTTVSQQIYRMGSLAVQTLIQSIEQKPREEAFRVVLEPKLIIRKSSRS